jgi:hypothetical protein
MIIEQKEHNNNKSEMQTKKNEIMFEINKRKLEANETPFEILTSVLVSHDAKTISTLPKLATISVNI